MAPPRTRPRRGAVERPINARTVRGTWLLVALPLLVAAFTVTRPQPLPPPALPPAFDGETASTLAKQLADGYPDRSPGSSGALGAAQWFRNQLRLYGFDAQPEVFDAEIPGHGRVELRNLVVVVDGPSPRPIVFLAHRDNRGFGAGENDNATGTAALIELARAYASVSESGVQARPAHTLVFVSTDGGAYGGLGAAHFAEHSPYVDNALAVVSLDALGGGRPRLVIDGDAPRSPSASFVRTAAVRVLEETGREPQRASALRQLLDLGFPFTLGEQGPLVARGVPALTLTTVADGSDPATEAARLRPARYTELGRAAQSLLGSLDAGLELTRGTTSYVYLDRRIVLGWAIQLVLIASLLPFAIGAVDLFARCRRRRIPLLPAARSLRTRLAFWGFVGVVFALATQLGLFEGGTEGRPLPPHAPGVGEPPLLGFALVVAVVAGGWLAGRERLIPRRAATTEETLGGYSVALLALGLVALLVVATNPYALLYLLPSLYAWLWLPQAHDAPGPVRGALLALGFAGPALLAVSFAERHALGVEAPWYLLSLLSTGYVPWLAAAVAVGWLATAAQLSALAANRYAPYPERRERPPAGPFRTLARRAAGAARARRATIEERDALEG